MTATQRVSTREQNSGLFFFFFFRNRKKMNVCMSCLERVLTGVGGRKLVWAERERPGYYSESQASSAET